jgi:uncharacterized protein YndB with AHSA1/START domain
MIKKILILLVVAIAAVCVIASFQSDDLNVTRSATINAAPDAVFKVVNDFRQWDAWSPWSKLDPQMKKTLEGPPEGVGAVYKWSGNNEVGEGSTKLVESKPNEKIGMKLEFVRPFAGSSDVQFTFAPEGAGTKVTWTMQSKKPFIGKVMGLFMDCEKMCGDQFSEGLDNLGKVVTAAPKA